MCFAPQRRALFRHLNFQKWSENGVFCTCWLQNVLRATTACNFSFLIWPAGSAPSALASLLFDPREPQIMWKHNFWRLSYLFAHLDLLSSGTFSFWSSSSLLFSYSSHLCFSSVHIVKSLTSKLPSINITTKCIRYSSPDSGLPRRMICCMRMAACCSEKWPDLSEMFYPFVLAKCYMGEISPTNIGGLFTQNGIDLMGSHDSWHLSIKNPPVAWELNMQKRDLTHW